MSKGANLLLGMERRLSDAENFLFSESYGPNMAGNSWENAANYESAMTKGFRESGS